MDKSEDKKYGLKMEAVFPKHVANVRQQVGEARTSEYVKKGNSLLSGLFSILLVSLLLIVTFILGWRLSTPLQSRRVFPVWNCRLVTAR